MDAKYLLVAVGICMYCCMPSCESHQTKYNPLVSTFYKTIQKKCVPSTVLASCILTPDPAAPFTLTGQIDLRQTNYCYTLGKLTVKASINGFPESKTRRLRGFHVHQFGDLKGGCTSAGGHYNPFNQTHGAPFDKVRHVGDFGNIPVSRDGSVEYFFKDRRANLFGKYSIIGRAIVVHAGRDDLGRGGNQESKRTGNAGARLACCVIGRRS